METSLSDFLLRMEGVNIDVTLNDTSQLSVIRGGSMLLRFAAVDLEAHLKAEYPEVNIESLSLGASVVLWLVKVRRHAVEALVNEAVSYLRRCYRHLTFVVDVQPLSEGRFPLAREAITARNRFRQLQQLSVPVPEVPEWEGVSCGVDGLDGLRTAGDNTIGSDRVSPSVWDRYRFGRYSRHDFFAREAGQAFSKLDFTDDFNALAGAAEDQHLENKMAVIYFDGNGFGKMQDACSSDRELHSFDCQVRTYRRDFLAKFLDSIQGDPDFKTKDGCLRLELLLWGGDEILLVVPAWQGFRTLQFFYEKTQNWYWQGRQLTHAGALIFCHHKTPIDRITALARELVGMIKESREGRERDLYDYVVLESVDYPAEPLARFWTKRYGAIADRRTPLCPVSTSQWLSAVRELQVLRDAGDIPRGRLHETVLGIAESPRHNDPALCAAEKQLVELVHDREERKRWAGRACSALENLFPEQEESWRWLHFVVVGDYLVPWKDQAHA